MNIPNFAHYRSSRPLLLGLLALAASVHATAAAADVPQRTGLDWLDWATEQLAFTLREAEPVPADAATPGTDPLAATHSIESIEIYRLQQEIRLLRELIEESLITRIMALETEVRDVKSALQAAQGPAYARGPVIPRPDDHPEMPVLPDTPPKMAQPVEAKLPPAEAFSFTVVNEWGRSPEVVQELGGDTATLIGLVGVVPARSHKNDVTALARELREKYDAYDNINIEVFDNEAAAQAYVADQTVDAKHHVASISRHRASGRDLVLYLGGGAAELLSAAE